MNADLITQWTEEFKANSTYKQPTGTNGLDRWRGVQPLHGWRDSGLRYLLDPPVTAITTVTSTVTSYAPKTEPSHIIGASVGGSIGLILTGAFIYWFFWVYVPRRPEQETTQERNGSVSSESVPISSAGRGEYELYVAANSGSSTRPPMQKDKSIILELDHSSAPGKPQTDSGL